MRLEHHLSTPCGNWCIRNPLEGTPLAADDPRMIALQAYVMLERRGVEIAPGKH